MTFFSKVKNPKNVLRPNSVSPTSRGGIFYCVGPCFLLQKTRQKAVEKKKPRKNPGQKKSWARSSRKFLQKTNSKFITTTPKMGRRRRRRPIFGAGAEGARVVVLNFVLVFCGNFLELLAQLFFGLDFF